MPSRRRTTPKAKPLLSGHRRNLRKIAAEDGPEAANKKLRAYIEFEAGMRQFGEIDAIQNTPKRRIPRRTVGSLDSEFRKTGDRDKMIATIRNLVTNFSICRGLLSQHVNQVVGKGPRLQMQSGDKEWDNRIEKRWKEFTKAKNFDVRGVVGFGKFVSLTERGTARDGDSGILLVSKGDDRGKLQAFEADRIADPPSKKMENRGDDNQFIFGIQTDSKLKPKFYHLYRRGPKFGRRSSTRSKDDYLAAVKPEDFIHSIDYDRFDQTRGISAFIAAINDLQDERETLENVKGSMKLENVLALIVTGKSNIDPNSSALGTLTDYETVNAEGDDETRKEISMGTGLQTLELGEDEDAKPFEKRTPGNNFEPFMMFLVRMSALAVDMPLELALWFFTRGSFANLKGAIGQYQAVVDIKRERIEDQVCDRIFDWWLRLAIDDDKELVPPDESEKVDPFGHIWLWPQMPLLEREKEIKADSQAYQAGVTTLSDMTGRRGKDFEEVTRQRAKEKKFLRDIEREFGLPDGDLEPSDGSNQPANGGSAHEPPEPPDPPDPDGDDEDE